MAYLGREAAKAPIVTADLPNDGVTLAKMTGGTDGNIISYDASGAPVAIATGTDGQVLTSTGAGSPPAFEGFPAGHVVNSGIVSVQEGNHTMNSSTPEAVFDYIEINCEIGNTIQFGMSGTVKHWRNTSSTWAYGYQELKHHTSSVSAGATSSLGTSVTKSFDGRILIISGTDANNYNSFNMTGAFIATATTHHLGLTFWVPGTNTSSHVYMASTSPVIAYHYELKGNVYTVQE